MKTNGQGKQIPAVSIIIPVYNVCSWLDQCIESVVNQTFPDFEALLIDDGSTDGSGAKCDEWSRKDSRIKVIHKKNEGPSKARNLGLQNAQGTYLVFIDSDDWIDCRYLEIMYSRAAEVNADMVECDVYRVNNETDKMTYRVSHGVMGVEYTLEEHMKYGYTAIWKCMIRKELFTEHDIEFPDCHSEARAIYALLLAVSSRIENVHYALYYYRILRKGSLSAVPNPRNEDKNATGIQALDILLQGFKKCGLYARYEKTLQEIVKLKLSDLLAAYFYKRKPEDFRVLTENYYAFIAEKFPGTPNFNYITFGGYNLNRILSHMNVLHNPYCRFNFSSIISLMNPVGGEISCKHKNRYREIMLERETGNLFWDILDEIDPLYLFMDCIEERFDIVKCGTGYLTKSDALDEADIIPDERQMIFRDSEACGQLWEESALRFIRRLETEYPNVEIVLVKNYLAEKVGDVQRQEYFDEIGEVRRTNRILEQYYDFFESHCNGVKVIEASGCNYYFTDKQYEYGAIPSHLNELANQQIAEMIERSIGI